MRGDRYQIALIFLGAIITVLLAIFIFREAFPEYKVYQNAYVALEEYRSSYTGDPVPVFKKGVKQIYKPAEKGQAEVVDRCVSCHVAMKLEHFSPTKLKRDVNGNVVVDSAGVPVKIPNDEYVWGKIDEQIAELTDVKVLSQLKSEGNMAEVHRRKALASDLEGMKSVHMHEGDVDMTKVLAMHPLIGREENPFDFHPVEEFGCTSCHGGNGRGLVSDRSHGPVLDEWYHAEAHGPTPKFLESDPDNDPYFSKVFNHKPGHRLLFHTRPILTGDLIQANCVQCHQSSKEEFDQIAMKVGGVSERKGAEVAAIKLGIEQDKKAVLALTSLRSSLKSQGLEKTLASLQAKLQDYRLSPEELDETSQQIRFLRNFEGEGATQEALARISEEMSVYFGEGSIVREWESALTSAAEYQSVLDQFLEQRRDQEGANGALFAKLDSAERALLAEQRLESTGKELKRLAEDRNFTALAGSKVDKMLPDYQRGKELFLSQSCYACHKITGLTRGGVGPELTLEGLAYPWFVKESIVWPQADVPASQMPNFKLDHEEIEDLMTFLMAQRGENLAVSEFDKSVSVKAWEAGAKLPWEKPIEPYQLRDLDFGRAVFATQGCAACHKLKGFESEVGFSVEKGDPSWEELWAEREWFRGLFEENLAGSEIVRLVQEHGEEIDQRIVHGVREEAILETIDSIADRGVESYLSNFKFAMRAKNKETEDALAAAKTGEERELAEAERSLWKDRVRRVMMAYIQEWGLGRDVGPRLHWSGIYRDEQWLIQHFRNPAAHTAKSIMPVLPFDDTKFYALTYTLQELGRRNREEVRKIWEHRGFDPEMAFDLHCGYCHGTYREGNGPVSEWIYPIPKNLRDATFLRNLTKERAIHSIVHGVKGGPMPPWGEAPMSNANLEQKPVMTQNEIALLVDWLFEALPGERVIKEEEELPKWRYTPEDVLEELRKEGDSLEAYKEEELQKLGALDSLPKGEGFYASLEPKVYKNSTLLAEASVKEIFEEKVADFGNPDEKKFYIRRKFYTESNLKQGQQLFIANCSHCHGKEGAGNGERSTYMVDAKPRMLTNLPWIRTRDDLRLLRSIKYGVPGTSMTPWGDKTSALQRMQMVMFIRSLTDEKRMRDDLMTALFQTYETSIQSVEEQRKKASESLKTLEKSYKEALEERAKAFSELQNGQADPGSVSQLYTQEVELLASIQEKKQVDSVLVDLSEEILNEKKLLENLGIALITRKLSPLVVDQFIDLVMQKQGRYSLVSGQLVLNDQAKETEEVEKEAQVILQALRKKLEILEEQIAIWTAKYPSVERTEQLQQLANEKSSLEGLLRRVVSDLKLANDSQERQVVLYKKVFEV